MNARDLLPRAELRPVVRAAGIALLDDGLEMMQVKTAELLTLTGGKRG